MAIDIKSRRGGGLGRGLEALFEDTSLDEPVDVADKSQSGESVTYVKTADLIANRAQPRKTFDQEKLNALAASIKEHGILQPIIARPAGDKYEIVAGERRWRAANIAELESVPCIIRKLSDRDNMLMALIENMQRENLNPMEEAEAFREMTDAYGLTHDEISRTVGRSRPYISNSMRLLGLPEQVQMYVSEGKLSGAHARTIAGASSPEKMIKYADQCIEKKLSVRELEKLVNSTGKTGSRRPHSKSQAVKAVEKELSGIVGTKVTINSKDRNKGKIEIRYSSSEELDKLIDGFRKFTVQE